MKEFECFQWIKLQNFEDIKFDEIIRCLEYFQSKDVTIDDSKLYQSFNVQKYFTISGVDQNLTLDEQWCEFFRSNNSTETFSELLKICQFYVAIPSSNATERVFSLIKTQWKNERNCLLIQSV